jgi:hypothetical protein
MAMPMAPENHILAAVVKLTTLLPLLPSAAAVLSSDSFLSLNPPFNIIPALRNPIPVTICAAILEVEFGSTKAEI